MLKWICKKLHPKTDREKLIEQITARQNYPVSQALDDLFQYLIEHYEDCTIIDNDGYWLTIGIENYIISVWVSNWPYAALNEVIILHKQACDENINHPYRLHDRDNSNILWSIDNKVPSGEVVLKFFETFYPELLRHNCESFEDRHQKLLAILNSITLSLNEKSKNSKHNVDKETQTVDNDKSGWSDCDNSDHSAIEGVDN